MVTVIASSNAWGLFQVITVICDCHKKVNYDAFHFVYEDFSVEEVAKNTK